MWRVIVVPIKFLLDTAWTISEKVDGIICRIKFSAYGVRFQDFKTLGIPHLIVVKGGAMTIGNHFEMINTTKGNPIGRTQRCSFFVDRDAVISIGEHVGMSSAALFAQKSITIGNNVKIGGGVCIYDTDFHALDAASRNDPTKDVQNRKVLPVEIKENAFIGAHSTILKGVVIGRNAIIGACSVVTKSVPDNEIWAGNPARFVKTI